jgi:hypothetical protein
LCIAHEGGFLTVGGPTTKKHLPGVVPQYVDFYGPNEFKININKVTIGGIDTDLNIDDFRRDSGSFVDSGTTLFYTTNRNYK